jgi:preprotein translocase subunit SecE
MAHQAPKPNGKSDKKSAKSGQDKSASKPVPRNVAAPKRPSLLGAKKPADTGRRAEAKPPIWQRFLNYLKNVRTELGKVIWPKRPEIIQSTLIVIATLIVVGLFIFTLDTLFEYIIKLISGGFVR